MNVTHRTGFLIFAIVVPILVLTVQYILYRHTIKGLRERFPSARWARVTATVMFVMFNAGFLYTIFLRPRAAQVSPWFLYGLAYPFFIWFAATIFIGITLLIAKLIKLPFWLGLRLSKLLPVTRRKISALESHPSYMAFDASRRRFLQEGMYGVAAISFAGSAYGMIVGRESCEATHQEFFVPNLPPALDGFSIALVSDVHSGMFMTRSQMEEYVFRLNGMGTDVIAVTGDFVNSLTDEVYPFGEAFSGLRAPLGVFGVTGNHDFYTSEPETVIREVNASGIRVLRDEHISIEKNGAKLILMGIDDVGSAAPALASLQLAKRGLTGQEPNILLCHRPYFLPPFSQQGINLILSGHTHGGQVSLGRFGDMTITPAALASPYVWGPYRHGQTQMYVSRGIGTVGLPIRLNCPPEITRIVLRSGANAV